MFYFDDPRRLLGGILTLETTMHGGGNTVEVEWPKRAGTETFEKYARLPRWHVEEAASLVAGVQPREAFHLNFHPMDSDPQSPAPYEGALNWGRLLAVGTVGQVISLYARARGVHGWGFAGENLYVSPWEFLKFCKACDVSVPRELRDAVRLAQNEGGRPIGESTGSRALRTEAEEREARYRAKTKQVTEELDSYGAFLRKDELLVLVNSEFSPGVRTVGIKTFAGYLSTWKKESAGDRFREMLGRTVRGDAGRPKEEEQDELLRKLPSKWHSSLEAHWKKSRALRKSSKSSKSSKA